MLTPEQFKILSRLYDCANHSEVRVRFMNDLSADDCMRFHCLVSNGMIDDSLRKVALTAKGLNALDEYQLTLDNARQQRAQEKADEALHQQLENERHRKDARRSWVQWTITTILSILSFFAGAVVEEFTGFMQWIASLFH